MAHSTLPPDLADRILRPLPIRGFAICFAKSEPLTRPAVLVAVVLLVLWFRSIELGATTLVATLIVAAPSALVMRRSIGKGPEVKRDRTPSQLCARAPPRA